MKIINKILNIDLKDNIKFNIIGLEKIRDEDEYGGYRFNIETMY